MHSCLRAFLRGTGLTGNGTSDLPRVAHLVEPDAIDAGVGAMLAAAIAVSRVDADHRVVVVGSRRDAELARACGLPVDDTTCPARGWVSAGIGSLRTVLGKTSFDVLHAWSARSALLAVDAAPESCHLATLARCPDSSLLSPLRRRWRGRLLALGAAAATSIRDAGLPMEVLDCPCDDRGKAGGRRDEIRASWEVDERTLVIGLVVDPIVLGDALTAVTAAVRLELAGRRARAVVHPASARRLDAAAWVRSMGRSELLFHDERLERPWTVAAGIDVGVLVSHPTSSPGETTLLRMMAAGVPIVAAADPVAHAVLGEGAGGIVADTSDLVNTVTRAMLRLHDRPAERRALGAAGARHAVETHAPDEFVRQLAGVYGGK